MFLTGIGDEAGNLLETQIKALKALGWTQLEARNITIPGFPKANLHDLQEPAFDAACAMLEESGISVCCFGSTIANWGKKIDDPAEPSLAEAKRAVPRMRRLGTQMVRIMSYAVRDAEDQMAAERFQRLREITRLFLDNGIQPLHENCMNYGGMGWTYTLELLEQVPGLKLVFDTANPVFNADRTKSKPWPKQDPWEFYDHARDHIWHVHIKDARWNLARNDADYTQPGEGDGAVRRIVKDLLANGYDRGFSMEPHVAAVFHDPTITAPEQVLHDSFVGYGQSFMRLLAEIQVELRGPSDVAAGRMLA